MTFPEALRKSKDNSTNFGRTVWPKWKALKYFKAPLGPVIVATGGGEMFEVCCADDLLQDDLEERL